MEKLHDANWTTSDASETYNIDRWGSGFFGIDEQGRLVVHSGPDAKTVAIVDAVESAIAEGLEPPFLVRYPDIIRQQIVQINAAFASAIEESQYTGNYRFFYPAKVNQHREVIQSVIESGRPFGGGVESGSKAELFALLLMTDESVPILCNGFKDHTMVEMAFRAMQLGRDITIVIEKPVELELLLECYHRIPIRPKLGVRVKLASKSGGRWNDSGGSKSKFGLSVLQLMEVVKRLRASNLLDCLELLHFHPGSQISNIRKIKTSLIEAARIYVDLLRIGAPLNTIDVGGGLAVDYTGQHSNSQSSRNYDLEEYANDVVHHIQQVCLQSDVPQPNIISESGRAITAHHSLLVVPVLKIQDSVEEFGPVDDAICQSANILKELKGILETIDDLSPSESFHDAQTAMDSVWQLFTNGAITLQQRSCAEQLAAKIYRNVASQLDELDFVPDELGNLKHQLADTYIANFSLFQAVPDSWALNQVFPVVPIHRLNERPTRQGVIGDITCDSDGQINCFTGGSGGNSSLPLHELRSEPYLLGIFLIGAYQEALSDDHNLMGNYHVVSVAANGTVSVCPGATTAEVLENVNHSQAGLNESIENSLQSALQRSLITKDEKQEIREFLESVMLSYTYLSATPEPGDNQVALSYAATHPRHASSQRNGAEEHKLESQNR